MHMSSSTLKDSGRKREFPTGSVRDDRTGKGRWDLLPFLALQKIAVHFELGGLHYGDRNWEKGQPLMGYFDSALRHIAQHVEGKRDEPHIVAAAWNLLCAIQTEEMIERGLLPKSLDDRPNYMPKTKLELKE